MATATESPQLPARVEATFSTLLRELGACNHQAAVLVERERLPRWCRRPLFFFLGYIARAEGRVTEADIAFAETLIKAARLSHRQRQRAIQAFSHGKQVTTLPPFKGLAFRLLHRVWPAPALKVAICLCHAAQIQGPPGKPRRYRCEDAIAQMGLPVAVSDDILESYANKIWPQTGEPLGAPETYEEACRLLGVTRRDALAVIKRAYRKKVSECHPDKLAQQALAPHELAAAKDRLLRLQQAWELIQRRHRPL